MGSVGTGWEHAGPQQGEGAPLSPQGSAPRRAQTMGSLCLAPPPLARRPASAPSPQSCFQFKRLQPAGAARSGGRGRDRSAERPCNFRGELTGSNTAPRCPDRRPRDRRRRPDGLARVVGAPLGRPPPRAQPGPAAASRQPHCHQELLPQKACVLPPNRWCLVVPGTSESPAPFWRGGIRGGDRVRSVHSACTLSPPSESGLLRAAVPALQTRPL